MRRLGIALLQSLLLVAAATLVMVTAPTPAGAVAAIDVDARLNGVQADTAPGYTAAPGETLSWTILVVNFGDEMLTSVVVTDSQGLTVTCPKTSLAPGEAMTCTAAGTAIAGSHQHIAAAAADAAGTAVSDDDSTWYTAVTEGCPLGYWKKHAGAWPPTGYSPSHKVSSVFSVPLTYPSVGDATLLRALAFKGGTSTVGAVQILVRAGTTALLDAAHPGIDYPRTVSDVLTAVNTALASGNRAAMLALAAQLDADNNGVCPLA